MKKFLNKMTGKSKRYAPGEGPASADTELQYPDARSLELPVPPPFVPQQSMVSNGSMRRPRRPREVLDLNYADYAPFAPQPQQQPAGPSEEELRQIEMDVELARQLAMHEMAPPPPPPPPVLLPPPPQLPFVPEPEPVQHQAELDNEANFQAELDAVLAESVVQADYDNILREIKEWVMDLNGALDDVEDAQLAARKRREELDEQFAAVNPEDEEGWEQARWVSECHTEVEGKLQELGWRLKPIGDAVKSLRDLDTYIREDQPPVQSARDALDRIIAKLLEDLNVMGFAFHHPIAPFGRQEGEGSSRDLEDKPRDPLRDLVHALIQQTTRISPPPRPRRPAPPPPPPPPTPPVVEEPVEEKEVKEVEVAVLPEPEPEPEPAPPSPPRPEPAPPQLPDTPEPSAESPPKKAPAPRPAAAVSSPPSPARRTPRSEVSMPRSTPRAPAEDNSGSHLQRVRTPPEPKPPRKRWAGIKPSPEDSIRRLPRVVALYHELQKGVVADAVGWRFTGGDSTNSTRRGSTNPSGYPGAAGFGHAGAAVKFAPASVPTRVPPATSRKSEDGAAEQSRESSEDGPSGSEAAAPAPPPTPFSPADMAQCAAEIADFKPATLNQASDFVGELRSRGASGMAASPPESLAAARWPQAKWAALADAADVLDMLQEMAAQLSQWRVNAQAGTIAESHRLASFMDAVTAQAGKVTYAHDLLRVRMAKHGIPWDSALLVDMRWAAQVAAAQLMSHALEEAKELTKSKQWQGHLMLQPLGHAAMGAFKVHQFCGGLNMAATALFDQLHELTIHYARMIDHQWLRNTKWA